MGLSTQQLDYLRSSDSRFQAHIGVFDDYTPTLTAPEPGDSGVELAPRPIPRCTPRYAVIDNSETIVLYGRDAYNRGIAYVGDANVSFALDGGSAGAVVDNGDGTADYTAPGSGSAIAQINMTATNSNGSKVAKIFVQYPKTTYDEIVAEVSSVSASIDQHGWKMLVRARGNVSALTVGKCVLLHVEDTWDGTGSTFGGYKYAEGQMVGYISETQYFEDGSGNTWLGLEVSSPWWVLENIKVGETYWGKTPGGGRLYLSDFAPVDAVWEFVNEITDWTTRHDAILWWDRNSIDDFAIDQSDLGTIIADVMARTLSVSYVDRYGALYCVPDPDVRADEFWGSPSSIFDSGGDGPLTEEFCSDYTITNAPSQRVKKLELEGYDSSKLGIWAISEALTGIGDIRTVRGLLCDDAQRLGNWAASKRAQMNRPWEINASLFLNHVVDLLAFVDVNFTNPSQSNAPTAAGQTWLHSLNYRPDVFNGGWNGGWRLLKRTEGDEDGVSAWGGTGIYVPPAASAPGISAGSNVGYGSGSGGWSAQPQACTTLVASWSLPAISPTGEESPAVLISAQWYEVVIVGLVTGKTDPVTGSHTPQYFMSTIDGIWSRRDNVIFSGALPYEVSRTAHAIGDTSETTPARYRFQANEANKLRTTFNDVPGGYSDNLGSYTVTLYKCD